MEHFKVDPSNLASPKPSTKSDPVWVLSRVQLLMSAYRKADYHDPEGFIATLGVILEQYPPEIVEYVTSPLTGIQRRLKFPPSPAEVVEACAAEIDHQVKVQRYSNLPPPLPRLPRPKFSVEQSFENMTRGKRVYGPFDQGREHDYRG